MTIGSLFNTFHQQLLYGNVGKPGIQLPNLLGSKRVNGAKLNAKLLNGNVRNASKRPINTVEQLMDGNLSDPLPNVPTLLTIDLWMEMSEAHLIVPALLAIKLWLAMSEAHLIVPALLTNDLWMAMSVAHLFFPPLLASHV